MLVTHMKIVQNFFLCYLEPLSHAWRQLDFLGRSCVSKKLESMAIQDACYPPQVKSSFVKPSFFHHILGGCGSAGEGWEGIEAFYLDLSSSRLSVTKHRLFGVMQFESVHDKSKMQGTGEVEVIILVSSQFLFLLLVIGFVGVVQLEFVHK